ncbi:hypothetical protein ACHAWX_003764 [Stephanocyclus meneghinianus]
MRSIFMLLFAHPTKHSRAFPTRPIYHRTSQFTTANNRKELDAPTARMAMPTWNDRYASSDYMYGTQPNDFLESIANNPRYLHPSSKILSIGEGEGRNAVHLGKLGHFVTGVDASSVGIEKARKLASEHGVTNVIFEVADLSQYDFGIEKWDAVVSIFCHLPPQLRRQVYRQIVDALKPGGTLILEAYTPTQLEYKTGGPPVAEMMCTLEGLREELGHGGWIEFVIGEEKERSVVEGTLHTGLAHVVQVVGRKTPL